MKLTPKQVGRLYNALLSMNGAHLPVEADGKITGAVFAPFVFPNQTKLNIARNIGLLRPLQEAYDEAKKRIIAEISPDGTPEAIDASPVLSSKFRAQHDDLLNNTTLELKGRLAQIQWADLERNQKITPAIIGDLGGLVRGAPTPAESELLPEDATL